MGVIMDGTIIGEFPETESFAVYYPAYPSSLSRAVETLGGIDEIAKRRSSKSRYIELRFRPEDNQSHPTFGDCRPRNSFLLKVSKKKSISSDELCADVVSKVAEAYHFNGMADYQYVLPVHVTKTKKEDIESQENEDNFVKGVLMDFENDDLMMLVPPLFSLKDIPEEIVLKVNSSLVPKELQKGVVQYKWEMDIEPCLAIPFAIKDILNVLVNESRPAASILSRLAFSSHFSIIHLLHCSVLNLKIPKKLCWEDYISKDSPEWEGQMIVSRLFDERPIWPRQSILERLVDDGHSFSNHQMRKLLYRTGYYFATGPFGKFWIRKGYDPRSVAESRIYQMVDFRMPGPIQKLANAISKDRLKVRWKDICKFQAIPSKKFTFFQIFELDDDYILQEIRKPLQKKTCTHSAGWLSRRMLEVLMLHIKIRFLLLFDCAVAKSLIKSSRKQLEKLKFMLPYEEPDPDEVDHLLTNKDKRILLDHEIDADEDEDPYFNMETDNKNHMFGGMESCSLQPVRDDEEEPHEDDEEEEELDENGMSYMVDDNMLSLNGNSSYIPEENGSSDYLQEILGSFHSIEGNKCWSKEGLDDSGTNDDEYQIFGEDSDFDDYLDD